MAYLSNPNHSKCTFSVIKNHVTTYGKFYKFEVISTCHTKALRNESTESPRCDMIGPSHPISNLRQIHFFIPENETQVEKEFRLKRQEVQKWNQDFWTRHNTSFVEERKRYIAANQPENSETPLSADEMSIFYKAFLDKKWRTHLEYNVEWYQRNAQLILLHLRVKLFQVWHWIRQPRKNISGPQDL